MDKIVFLDIDGVLQPSSPQDRFNHNLDELKNALALKYKDEKYLAMDKYDLGAIYYDWHPEAIENLRSLLILNTAKVVISSDWRRYSALPRLKLFFQMHDLQDFILDCTPIIEGAVIRDNKNSFFPKHLRESEISSYLDSHKDNISNFVVLDDIDLSAGFPDNFVLCRDYFNKKNYKLAMRILSKGGN